MASTGTITTPQWQPAVVAAAWDDPDLLLAGLNTSACWPEEDALSVDTVRRAALNESNDAVRRWLDAVGCARPLLRLPGTNPLRRQKVIARCDRIIDIDVATTTGPPRPARIPPAAEHRHRGDHMHTASQERRGAGTGIEPPGPASPTTSRSYGEPR